ncbi:uncharacterized protein LOC107608226 [Arachis ipaensis]|uniref:uncharacterized protein LOC107608226 n=1 Tax=Arachis ipaensis TaxID=130454 RepID=UPI000A2B07ED|nr:uncharacterized protein LOC107608226 [Arachis ipaensis]
MVLPPIHHNQYFLQLQCENQTKFVPSPAIRPLPIRSLPIKNTTKKPTNRKTTKRPPGFLETRFKPPRSNNIVISPPTYTNIQLRPPPPSTDPSLPTMAPETMQGTSVGTNKKIHAVHA